MTTNLVVLMTNTCQKQLERSQITNTLQEIKNPKVLKMLNFE